MYKEYFTLKPDRRTKISKRRSATTKKKKKIYDSMTRLNVLDESLEVDLEELARRD